MTLGASVLRGSSFSGGDRSLAPGLEMVEGAALPHVDVQAAPSMSSRHSPARPTFIEHKTPKDRFRAAVQKVIKLHRTSTIIISHTGIGAEPGIDPRKKSAYLSYGYIRQNCEIEVMDYSSVRSTTRKMSNSDFVNMMTMDSNQRQPWSKVRWINIGGISWDVMSALAIKYELHPLALEGVLAKRGHARSKADYYAQHLSLRVLCHTIPSDDDIADGQDENIAGDLRAASPAPMTLEDEEGINEESDEEVTAYDGSAQQSKFSMRKSKFRRRRELVGDVEDVPATTHSSIFKRFGHRSAGIARRAHWDEGKAIGALKQGERVNVKIVPMYIFLWRDGTVITVHPSPDLRFTAPITERLHRRDSVLRTTADPSLLVQSLLDLIVDSALQIVDEYHGKILNFEQDILLKPKMSTVRHLHIISGDITLHKRTLGPVKTLIYGLRRYDRDRCAAVVDTSKTDPVTGVPIKVTVEPYMSQKAIIYLADVLDHMEHVLTCLDMFEAIAENLVDFTFNLVSNDMSEVMRRLTLATIIFLPLSLLAGYFGMNFDRMWSILDNNHSDIVYWIIALPLMAIVVPSFLYGDVIRMVHYLKKKTFIKTLHMS